MAFLLITFLHVVFGEFIPKSLALHTPDRISLWVAQPLLVFEKLTRPLIATIRGTGNWILGMLGADPMHGEQALHSVEELLLLIEDTEEAGILDPEQAEFAAEVFRLSNKHVVDCMVPREKMAALELRRRADKVLEAVARRHTRMPVYEGRLDNIVGIVNTKDLFYLFSLQGVVVLEDALYPALFFKPDENRRQRAAAVQSKANGPWRWCATSKGKILGLITLEDILEEIVGDIEDEHDRRPPKVKRRFNRPVARPIKFTLDPRTGTQTPRFGKPTGS